MNKRRKLVIALGAAVLPAPFSSFAQQQRKVWRVGFLGPASAEGFYTDLLWSLRAGLRERGYVEGQNIVFEYRFAEDKFERLPGLAVELVRSKVDVIVAHASSGVGPAKQATSTIPIVMLGAGDPVGTGFVASLARPGGNVTGVSALDVGLAAKRLELLKEVLPKLSRVAVLRHPTSPSGVLQYKEAHAAARTLGIELQLVDVRDLKEIESAFPAMVKARAGALIALGDPLFLSQQKQIADLAVASRLPSIFSRNENVEAGGLMSYGPALADMFLQAATYVDKILKGAKPADLPVEQPTRFVLVINTKTATALGIKIPQSVLLRAGKVIE